MQFLLFMFDSPVQIAMVAGVVMLLFGANKLPQLAKSLGATRKAFKEGMREADEEERAEAAQKLSPAPAIPLTAPQLTNMSDEALLEEIRKRSESKQA